MKRYILVDEKDGVHSPFYRYSDLIDLAKSLNGDYVIAIIDGVEVELMRGFDY